MLACTLRLSQQLVKSRLPAVACSCSRPFATNPEFTEEAKQFVEAAKQLKGKPGRAAQIEAYAQSKEAARAIAEKMSGEEIDWAGEETKARNNLKRKMMEWGKCSSLDLWNRLSKSNLPHRHDCSHKWHAC